MKKNILLSFLLLFVHFFIIAQVKITPSDAHLHIGDSVSVTGTIYGGHFYKSAAGQPTVLYLSDTFPNVPLMIVIPGIRRSNFQQDPVSFYSNKQVIINGVVKSIKSNLQITVSNSVQISLYKAPTALKTDTTFGFHGNIILNTENLDTYNNCPLIGESTNQRLQDLNKSKNRYTIPSTENFNHNVTVESLLKPGDDRTRWATSDAVELTGYVLEVKPGGLETCNCHSSDKTKMDTHIVLIADTASTKGSQRIIVEITARMRSLMAEQGVDWNTDKIKARFQGHWVTVKGWLFFDEEHTPEAENTKPGNPGNWRGTAWEVHPITSIELANHN